MINVKPELVSALESNQALISLLGGNRVYNIKAPDAEEFPRITIIELTNFDSNYADDQATASEVHLQIDIWSKGSTSDIAIEVDNTMKSLSYKRDTSADFYEEDTQIFHKALRYSTVKPLGGS